MDTINNNCNNCNNCPDDCECHLYDSPDDWVDVTHLAISTTYNSTGRYCDMIGCTHTAHSLHTIAPGTSAWLCSECMAQQVKE